MEKKKGFAVFGIIEGLPDGKIPLIQDKGKPSPAMWKLPGGQTEDGECPEFALIRELNEEIGINIIPPTDKDVIFEKDLGNHIFRVYRVKYYNGEIAVGDEVKWLKLFSLWEIAEMISDDNDLILPEHAVALVEYRIYKAFGPKKSPEEILALLENFKPCPSRKSPRRRSNSF